MKKRPSSGVIRTPWSGRGVSRGRRLGSRAATACDVCLQGHVGGAMRSDRVAIGKKFPGVFEDNDAVAEQAPTLLWVADYRPGRLAVRSRCFRTGWRVRAHGRASWLFPSLWSWSRSDSSVPHDRRVRYGALLLFSGSSVVVSRGYTSWYLRATARASPEPPAPGSHTPRVHPPAGRSPVTRRPAAGQAAGDEGTRTIPPSRCASRSVSSASASLVHSLTGVVAMAFLR